MSVPLVETVAASRFQVERCQAVCDLTVLHTPWDGLSGGVPFRRWEWLETWWKHYRTSADELCVLTVRDHDGEVVALAPWYLHHTPARGRVVRFLGSGRVYSDYLTVLCLPGAEASVAKCLADWLVRGEMPWDALELARIADDDPFTQHLLPHLHTADHLIDHRPSASCWHVDFPDTWETYVMRLSKSRRERVRQLIRRQFETGRAVRRQVSSPDDLDKGFDVLRTLHKRRREELGQKDCFASPRFARFLRETAERFLATDDLRLQWIELEGRPVACQIDFAGEDTVYYYQSGIEPSVGRERPGWLGTIGALRQAMDDGFRSFDFLGGDEAYKSHWRAKERTVSDLRIVPPHAAARCRHLLWKTAESLKQCAKVLLRSKHS